MLADKLLEYGTLLLAEGQRTNLVGAKRWEELIAPHLLDSLAPLRRLDLAEPVVDLGSGGGLPGIPAALAWPCKRFVLIEPRKKRADFLARTVAALNIANAVVERTAVRSGTPGVRAWAGSVLARAIAKPAEALRLGLPLLKRGGKMVLYLGRQSQPSADERSCMAALGGRLLEALTVTVPALDAQRHAWVIVREPRPASARRRSRERQRSRRGKEEHG
jgi:16S rRNA (guanine527-N7)-methyltransferase